MSALPKSLVIKNIIVTESLGSGGADGLSSNIADLNGSYPELFPARNE
jgi:hypothetical protein